MNTKQTALVTGATSGIGKAFAVYFAQNGYDLIVTGRRVEKLECLAKEMHERYGTVTKIIKAEFSIERDVLKVMKAIGSYDNIRVLVNNAGYGSGIEFSNCQLADHLCMLHVHVEASIRLVYAVLPQMIDRNEGTIINVSSIGAYLPGPGSVMYTGTKLFLAGFSESLQTEVHKHRIKVRCLCPGMTYSDFHSRRCIGHEVNTGKWMWMEPEKLVKIAVKSLDKQKVIVVAGSINKIIVAAVSMLPKRMYYFIAEQSSQVKLGTGLFNRMKQFVEKTVPFFFSTHTDQI
jgi:short-subunit dehydrogenase